ncbi:hypothetical protein RJ639_031838 [Escallonia herrerae]|uniref:Thioredoxin domain-containing protein n=1 Tax=Escallonia herrerae TaxID=1293975 RepID=A0AA88X143_9ASTE|nr:hypothetical protein RJ639_031838 [Escallonia herrerae]
MAGVLETLAVRPVPRASAFPTPSLAPIASSSVSSLSRPFNSPKFSEFRGLKAQSTRSSGSASSGSRLAHRGGRIVCEAQKTAVEVEFWAPWCGPCRMIHPVIDELAKQYMGKLKCYKVNTDESPSIATRYGIRSIPTVIIFKGGEKKDAVIGAVPKSTLTTSIEKFL